MLKKENKKDNILSVCIIVIICLLVFVLLFAAFRHGDGNTGSSSAKSTETEIVPWEFKLLSAYVEMRNVTNNFGGVIRTDKYFHYSFADYSGKVLFDEKQMYDIYDGNYSLKFKVGEENKVLQYNYPYRTTWVFIMTPEMYNQVFQTK